jgi:hypothetical protein
MWKTNLVVHVLAARVKLKVAVPYPVSRVPRLLARFVNALQCISHSMHLPLRSDQFHHHAERRGPLEAGGCGALQACGAQGTLLTDSKATFRSNLSDSEAARHGRIAAVVVDTINQHRQPQHRPASHRWCVAA